MPKEAKSRTSSKRVENTPGCKPLKVMYARAVAVRPKTWGEIEDDFLRAMEAFDANVASGVADMGDLQNGKGDFFNDILALLLECCAGITFFSRGDVPGLIFPRHKLDVTYPATGVVGFLLEAKAVGTPKHPGNPSQKDIGRPGSSDLDKRIKEAAFKTIDLKAEYARIMAARGQSPQAGPGGNLTTWLRSVQPKSYMFIMARVVSKNDSDRVVRFADTAGLVMDAVGVYCYEPVSHSQPTTYRRVQVPTHIELDRVLYRACEDLVAMKAAPPVPPPPGPSLAAQK